MSYVSIPEDGGEPEGRYLPREDSSSHRNVPLLVGGIVMATAGGIGVLWFLVEVAMTEYGTSSADSGARMAGAGAMGLIGLGVGIPMIVVGARKSPGGRGWSHSPQVAIGPGAVALQWCF